jgi:hypothetical protein
MELELNDLLGRTVHQVLANADLDVWRFVTDQGNVDYVCYGDCCSESWVNHIADLDVLIGQKVEEVEEIDLFSLLGAEPEPTKQEVDKVMFHRVRTDKGVCVIEFRNSSNGYYGGTFERTAINEERDPLSPVTEDF